MKYQALFSSKKRQNQISSNAVVINTLRVKKYTDKERSARHDQTVGPSLSAIPV